MLYCVSLALSVFCLDFVIDFGFFSLLLPTGLLSLHSLFPSIYDKDDCASTAVYLLFRMGLYFVTTGWIFEISLCENSINQSIQPINQLNHPLG